MMTQGTPGGAPAGWYIDSLPSATPRGSNIGPNYIEHFGSTATTSSAGCAHPPTSARRRCSISRTPASTPTSTSKPSPRAPTTRRSTGRCSGASASDRAPWWAARSTRPGGRDAASTVFEEALERFRGYYVHEPVILYFDTGDPHPERRRGSQARRHSRLHGPLSRRDDRDRRLGRYPGVRGLQCRAGAAARRRSRQPACAGGRGSEPYRCDSGVWGSAKRSSSRSTARPPGATQPITAGRLQANRRVEIRFVHTVSNHPIVMP